MKTGRIPVLPTVISALSFVPISCVVAADAELSSMVAVCSFRASDTATKHAVAEALRAAQISFVMAGSLGTTVDASAADETAARKVVQELVEVRKLPIRAVNIAPPPDQSGKPKTGRTRSRSKHARTKLILR